MLCYHARPRAGLYIWRGKRPAPFLPDGLNLLVRLFLFPIEGEEFFAFAKGNVSATENPSWNIA